MMQSKKMKNLDLQRRQQELERLEAARLTRMQQMSRNSGPTGPYGMNGGQFMDQQIIDGPLGRNPPTFGGAGGRGGIPPLMTGSPSNGMGMHQGGRGGGTGCITFLSFIEFLISFYFRARCSQASANIQGQFTASTQSSKYHLLEPYSLSFVYINI